MSSAASPTVSDLTAQVALLREAGFIFIEARKHNGYGIEDAERAMRAALAATPESASAELAELRKDRAKYAEEVQQLAEILNGGARTAAPFRVVREWAQEAAKDKAQVELRKQVAVVEAEKRRLVAVVTAAVFGEGDQS